MEDRVFIYKDKQYYIESFGEMKIPNGNWVDCTIYISLESGKRYCRFSEDFNNKFELV